MRERLKQLDSLDTPDQWRDIELREPRHPSPEAPSNTSRLVAAFVATLVAVAGVGFGLVGLGNLDSSRTGATPSPEGEPPDLAITKRTIETGLRFPEGVAIGNGAVWVATLPATGRGGDLLRLDLATGDVLARIAMPSLPSWEFGGAGITTGLGSVWVAAYGTGDHADTVVYRVDPATNSMTETIDIGAGDAADIWVDETGIWVLSFPTQAAGPMFLYRADPISHEVTDTIEIPATWSQSVFVAGGWVYVLGNTDDSNGAPPETLFKIDPSTRDIVAQTQPAGGSELFMSVSLDRLWFFDDGLRALDAATGHQVVGPLDLPDRCCAGLVADGDGGVWVISTSGEEIATGVWHLDRDGQIVAFSDANPGDDVDGIAAAYDAPTTSIWIVHYEDTVLRMGVEPLF